MLRDPLLACDWEDKGPSTVTVYRGTGRGAAAPRRARAPRIGGGHLARDTSSWLWWSMLGNTRTPPRRLAPPTGLSIFVTNQAAGRI